MPTSDLTPDEIAILATYNSERHRGILHDEHWKSWMAELQRTFDNQRAIELMRVDDADQ